MDWIVAYLPLILGLAATGIISGVFAGLLGIGDLDRCQGHDAETGAGQEPVS
jgi:hypothetical protein